MAPPTAARRGRAVERLVNKFCTCLRDSVRLEPQPSAAGSLQCTGAYPSAISERLWLCVRFDDELTRRDESGSRWRRVRELLEAVSVLSAAACCREYSLQRNPRFWKQLLEVQCRVRSASTAEAFGRIGAMETPMFLLDFSFVDVTPDLLKLCRSFLTARRRAKKCMRISFTAAMTQLEAIAKQHCWRPAKIRIGFLLNRCGLQRPLQSSGVEGSAGNKAAASHESSTLQQLQELLSSISARAATIERHMVLAKQQQQTGRLLDLDPSAWDSFFYEASLLEVSASELAKSDLARVAQIVSNPSARLRELVLSKTITSSSEQEYTTALGTLVSECFSADVAASSSSEPEVEEDSSPAQAAAFKPREQAAASLERFVFDWNVLNLSLLSSLFSAIHCSSRITRSVSDLSLIGSFRRYDGDPTLPWAWLAYGVFHATSSSRVQSLDLSTNTLCHDDVNVMKRVLTMENFRAKLLGLEDVLDSEQNRVSGSAKTVATVWPYCAARLKKQASLWPSNSSRDKVLLRLNDESVWFEVFQHDTKWTCVLVPGYGVLWTRTKMVLQVEKRERQAVPRKIVNVRKLMLNSIVGKKSERMSHVVRELLPLVGGSLIHLELRLNPLSNIALAAIVSSCPQLRHLDISDCELQTIGAILDAYERGACRISSLVMPENQIREQEVRRLCALLRDPSATPASSATASLRFLDLDQNPIGRQGLLAIGRLLASNRVLQTVILSKSEDPDGQLRGRFAIHEHEPLSVQPLLGLQQRALLSAASAVPALRAIDVPVLQTIFAFSESQVLRRVVWK